MSELKKCPFCNGEAAITKPTYTKPGIVEWGIIQCQECGLELTSEDGIEDALAKWNRRAQPENEPLTRCKDCTRWDKSISFMGAHACAYWSPSRKEPRYTEWFEFCSFASAKPERSEG